MEKHLLRDVVATAALLVACSKTSNRADNPDRKINEISVEGALVKGATPVSGCNVYVIEVSKDGKVNVNFADTPHAQTDSQGKYLIKMERAALKRMQSFTLFVTNCDPGSELGAPFAQLSREGRPLLISPSSLTDEGQLITVGTSNVSGR
jgi:hypothetical protein